MANAGIAGSSVPQIVPTQWPGPDIADPIYHDSVEDERLYRKQRLAASFRLFSRFGFDMGGAGHITARDPEFPDHFWVNPLGRHFSRICVSDLLRVDHEGNILEGEGMLNRAAFAIHSQVHKARPDVIGAAHSHSLYGKVWATLGRKLSPISQDAAIFFEDHGLFDDYSGVVNELSEGERIGLALGNHKAVILRNHGLLTVGKSVEGALWWFLAMENACKAQILAESVGTPIPMETEVAQATRAMIGCELAAVYAFQPYWEQMLYEEPDFLT